MVLHTMLVYRNQHFCTCRVHTRIYSPRMAVAGGQLSCSIFTFSCTDIAVHGLTMYSSWHMRMYAFLKKCCRKADHLPQPFLGSIYVYEPCMYRNADSCTLALYVGSWRLYSSGQFQPTGQPASQPGESKSCSQKDISVYVHRSTMSVHFTKWCM